MSNPQAIAIADYDYPLPDERIAKFPLAQRDQSKLLVYRHGEIGESLFHNIGDHLPETMLFVAGPNEAYGYVVGLPAVFVKK